MKREELVPELLSDRVLGPERSLSLLFVLCHVVMRFTAKLYRHFVNVVRLRLSFN